MHELKLPVKPLPKTHTLQFANSATIAVSHYVPCISLTLYGIYENNPRLPLYFNTGALIMESPQDMLIGIPFLRYWNIVSHFCNNTKVYTTKLGHNVTIPLSCSTLTQPCFSTHCRFHNIPYTDKPLPLSPPFTSPTTYDSITSAETSNLRMNHIAIPVDAPQHVLTYTTQNRVAYIPTPTIPKTIPIENTVTPDTLYCSYTNFIRHTHNNIDNVYLVCFKPIQITNTHSTNTSDTPFATSLKQDMLQLYPHVFPETLPRQLPPTDRLEHAIDLTPDYKIPQRKLYRQSEKELIETRKQITEYLEAGHIRPSTSSFGAPVLLVRKKRWLDAYVHRLQSTQ